MRPTITDRVAWSVGRSVRIHQNTLLQAKKIIFFWYGAQRLPRSLPCWTPILCNNQTFWIRVCVFQNCSQIYECMEFSNSVSGNRNPTFSMHTLSLSLIGSETGEFSTFPEHIPGHFASGNFQLNPRTITRNVTSELRWFFSSFFFFRFRLVQCGRLCWLSVRFLVHHKLFVSSCI